MICECYTRAKPIQTFANLIACEHPWRKKNQMKSNETEQNVKKKYSQKIKKKNTNKKTNNEERKKWNIMTYDLWIDQCVPEASSTVCVSVMLVFNLRCCWFFFSFKDNLRLFIQLNHQSLLFLVRSFPIFFFCLFCYFSQSFNWITRFKCQKHKSHNKVGEKKSLTMEVNMIAIENPNINNEKWKWKKK